MILGLFFDIIFIEKRKEGNNMVNKRYIKLMMGIRDVDYKLPEGVQLELKNEFGERFVYNNENIQALLLELARIIVDDLWNMEVNMFHVVEMPNDEVDDRINSKYGGITFFDNYYDAAAVLFGVNPAEYTKHCWDLVAETVIRFVTSAIHTGSLVIYQDCVLSKI